jgi:hypothetical protein
VSKSGDDWLDGGGSNRRTHHWRHRSKSDRVAEDMLKAWYGEDDGRLETEAHQPDARMIGDLIDSTIDQMDRGWSGFLRRLVEQWPDLVTPAIAAVTAPQTVQNDTLLIAVNSAPWMMQMRMHEPQIRAIVQQFSKGKVTKVRFVAGGKTRRQ